MELENVSVLNIMPPNLAADHNVKVLARAFDEVLRNIISKIPGVAIIPNLVLSQIVNETLIDLLAWQFHVDFYSPDLPIDIKIGLVRKSIDWHTRKGTPSTLEEIITQIFADAHIQEWYEYGGPPYHFRITTAGDYPNDETIAKIFDAINSVKNTRSHLNSLTSIIVFNETVKIQDEKLIITLKNEVKELFINAIKYNGSIKFDGQTANREIPHKPPFKYSTDFVDELKYSQVEPCINEAPGMNEAFFTGMRKHHSYNGKYKYNRAIQFDGMYLFVLETK